MTGIVYLPIVRKERTSDVLRVAARLTGDGVDLKWLRAGVQKLLDSGKAVVRQMGSYMLAPAGRLLGIGDSELTAVIVDNSAAKLVDAGVYGWLALTVADEGVINGVVMRGQITGASLVDSKDAPFLGKRRASYVDVETATLQRYAASHPDPAVRQWCAEQVAPPQVTAEPDIVKFQALEAFARLRFEGRV